MWELSKEGKELLSYLNSNPIAVVLDVHFTENELIEHLHERIQSEFPHRYKDCEYMLQCLRWVED